MNEKKLRVYVASSWRNVHQPWVVDVLRRIGLDVYDFRRPTAHESGFSWAEVDPQWESWSVDAYRAALGHPIAVKGYDHDIAALRACDACVLVLPSGRSASWEFGYAMGQGKRGVVFMPQACEPELMYREAAIISSIDELRKAFGA